jgi:signal transduction histidine kinase
VTTDSHPQPKVTILCVEDDPATRNLLTLAVSMKFPGVGLHFAENGKIGLELFREYAPDIVITDINMPVMDGIQMAREIKALNPETIIIVVSAYSDKPYLLNAIEIGIDHYVLKPIDHHRLFAVIARSLAEIKLVRQVEAQKAEIERLASFTQLDPNPVIETDMSGRITYHNDAAGETVQAVAHSGDVTLFLPADLPEILRMFREGEATRFYREVAMNESFLGENIYFAKQFESVRIYTTDITENRKMQDELLRAQKLESLGVLAGGIAHDFNNILTGILGSISLARIQVGEEHRAAARLAECEKALNRATELARQLLTFARGGEPVKGDVDVEQLLRDVASFSLHGSQCKADIRLAKELWHLNADGGQIHQLLNNLILNSCQAMPGGGTLTFSAVNEIIGNDDAPIVSPGRYVKISVTDQGCGIPPEDLPRIFDPYFTTKSAGTGLGLASAFSIAKRHGGAISVSSTPGVGTTFHITLPAADGNGGVVTAVAEQLPAAIVEASVLVMDDEEIIRSLATEMLQELGYRVTTCSDGREAVNLYREFRDRGEPFAAVILDMTVPGGMGGRDAAAQILAFDPDAVLVVSSGYSGDHIYKGKNDPLFRGVVAKPYNLQQLAQELSRVISRL